MKLVVILTLITAASAAAQTPATSPSAPPQSQDQITVTANRSSTPLGETAKTVYTLTSQQLHDYPAVTLDESLRQHAGFELFRRAPSRIANPTSEGISLRGLGSTAASRTLVLEDGAPLNDPFGGYIHWSEQPQPTIEDVTIVTGGGSDLYGSSALGGVIDIIPTSITPSTLYLSGLGGSQSTSDLTAFGSTTFAHLGALASGESLRTGGYIVTAPSLAGTVDIPANVLSQTYHLEIGRRNFDHTRLFLTGNLLNESRDNGTPLQTNATRLWRYLAGYETPDSEKTTARLRLFGSDQGYRQSFSSIPASRNSESLTRLQRVHTQELGAATDATLHLGPFAAVVGADIRDIRASDNETPISAGQPNGLQDTTARQRFLGAFGEILAAKNHWSGAFSLRADRADNLSILQTTNTTMTSTLIHPPDRKETILSPRLGLVRTIHKLELHASGFRAFRTPTMNELYRTGQVGQEITLANASLTSERGTGWEAGVRFKNLRATYFWTIINRPVSAVLISQTATTITNQRVNLGQIRSRGIELAADFHPTTYITATLGYQYADATVTKFSANPSIINDWIPQVPRQSFTAQLHATTKKLGDYTLSTRASGHDYDDSANQYPLNSFFQIDLSAHRQLTQRLALSFLAQNLTNQRPQVSRTPILTLGSPIVAEAGLQLNLSKTVK